MLSITSTPPTTAGIYIWMYLVTLFFRQMHLINLSSSALGAVLHLLQHLNKYTKYITEIFPQAISRYVFCISYFVLVKEQNACQAKALLSFNEQQLVTFQEKMFKETRPLFQIPWLVAALDFQLLHNATNGPSTY